MQIAEPIEGVLFDMDGVVVRQRLDFPAIKQEIFGDTQGFILERMATLSPPELAQAEAILERHEGIAAASAELMEGIRPFLEWLHDLRLPRGLVTRNSRKSVEIVLARLSLAFEAVVTREDAPPKPAPDPVWLACRRMGIAPGQTMFVGDFEFDMLAGRRAGVRTVLLRGPLEMSPNADLVVSSFEELREVLEQSRVALPGRDPR